MPLGRRSVLSIICMAEVVDDRETFANRQPSRHPAVLLPHVSRYCNQPAAERKYCAFQQSTACSVLSDLHLCRGGISSDPIILCERMHLPESNELFE